MRKRYSINGHNYWYEEGTQPKNAIEIKSKKETKKEVVKETIEVKEKVVEPKNKVVKTTKRK